MIHRRCVNSNRVSHSNLPAPQHRLVTAHARTNSTPSTKDLQTSHYAQARDKQNEASPSQQPTLMTVLVAAAPVSHALLHGLIRHLQGFTCRLPRRRWRRRNPSRRAIHLRSARSIRPRGILFISHCGLFLDRPCAHPINCLLHIFCATTSRGFHSGPAESIISECGGCSRCG